MGKLGIIVEKVAVSSQEVVKRDTLKIYDVKYPKLILGWCCRSVGQVFYVYPC